MGLFIACLTDQFQPRVGVAVVRVLEHLGCSVEFPALQTCCGQPMFNSGLSDEARVLGGRMVEVFAGFDAVVTASGSCAAMVRAHLPGVVGTPAAAELAGRTYEFVEFVTRVLKVDVASMGVRWEGSGGDGVAVHPSCHLRELGLMEECGRMLAGVEGVRLVPLTKGEQCCGFGGTFAVRYADISGAMAADKAACVRASGAGTLVVNDAGCAMNIGGACRRAGFMCGW